MERQNANKGTGNENKTPKARDKKHASKPREENHELGSTLGGKNREKGIIPQNSYNNQEEGNEVKKHRRRKISTTHVHGHENQIRINQNGKSPVREREEDMVRLPLNEVNMQYKPFLCLIRSMIQDQLQLNKVSL